MILEDSPPPDEIKKPYTTPNLYVYGDIRDITGHTAAMARGDNPGGGGGSTFTLP